MVSLRKPISRDLMPVFLEAIQQSLLLFQSPTFESLIQMKTGSEIYETMIQLLSEIIQDTSTKVFDSMLPDVIRFCESDIQKILTVQVSVNIGMLTNKGVDLLTVRMAFYDLVFKIPFYHWKYFFGTSNNTSDTHHQALIGLIQILVKSFQETNSDVIKQTLSHLDALNERFFLYSKPFFRQVLCVPFLEFFFDICLSGSHDCLKEEIMEQMSKMMLVDLASFRNQVGLFI